MALQGLLALKEIPDFRDRRDPRGLLVLLVPPLLEPLDLRALLDRLVLRALPVLRVLPVRPVPRVVQVLLELRALLVRRALPE